MEKAGLSNCEVAERILLKYYDFLAGGESDANDPDVHRKLEETDADVYAFTEKLCGADGCVFDDLRMPQEEPFRASSEMTATFVRLAVMAAAYNMPGAHYCDENLKSIIINSMAKMNRLKFNANDSLGGNWWDWQIGSPIEILKCLTLMRGMPDELKSAYIAALRGNVPLRAELYPGDANDLWLASINTLTAAISADITMLSGVMRSVNTCFFKYAPSLTRRDGFYRDGSYIMHEYYPYTGSYGVSALEHIAKLAYLTDGTEFSLTPENKSVLLDWVDNSVVPVIYGGAMLDCVRGRVMSRKDEDCRLIGHAAARAIYLLAGVYDTQTCIRLRAVVKHWAEADTYRNIFYGKDQLNNNNSVFFIKEIKRLLNDAGIIPLKPKPANYLFNEMNRAIAVRDGFCFAVAAHSGKIYNYEICNGENRKGWHTADGMTYLYNGDLGQYCDDYWCTIDPYRLPGATVLVKSEIPSGKPNGSAIYGGAVLERVVSVCAELKPFGQTLTARKSWFVFDGEIVALGSDISSRDGIVETVAENRKLPAGSKITGLQNGNGMRWAHIAGNDTNSDIGYCFTDSGVFAQREKRRGKWSDINGAAYPGEQEFEEEYFSLIIPHGENPNGDKYGYYILPGKSRADTEIWALNPDVEILADGKTAHAVYHKKLNITAVNFFEGGCCPAVQLASDAPACILIKREADVTEIAVASPAGGGKVCLESGFSSGEIVYADNGITVEDSPALRLTAYLDNSKILRAAFRQKDTKN